MLLILSANSLRNRIAARGGMTIFDLPRFTREQLDLHGMLVPTWMLAGASMRDIDRFRDEADKAECPCLVLVEGDAQDLGGSEKKFEAALERMTRVLRAGQRLGCNAVGCSIKAPADPDALEETAHRTKQLLEQADRLQINLLLAPHLGLTETPEGLTGLIKKVGGFRIGSLPDFQQAAESGDDVVETLRRIVPYASAVIASATEFDEQGRHVPYSFDDCMEALTAVGYDGLLAVEYRGKGDAAEGVKKAKAALQAAMEAAANK